MEHGTRNVPWRQFELSLDSRSMTQIDSVCTSSNMEYFLYFIGNMIHFAAPRKRGNIFVHKGIKSYKCHPFWSVLPVPSQQRIFPLRNWSGFFQIGYLSNSGSMISFPLNGNMNTSSKSISSPINTIIYFHLAQLHGLRRLPRQLFPAAGSAFQNCCHCHRLGGTEFASVAAFLSLRLL
jgi:hypothetical protein